MMEVMKTSLRRMLARNSTVANAIGRVGKQLYLYNKNYDFNMERNGETWLMTQLSAFEMGSVMDVGANVGNWSLHAAREMKPNRLVAVEPVSSTYETLQAALSDIPGASAAQMAFGAEVGSVDMQVASDKSSHFAITRGEPRGAAVQTVKVETGDAYCRDNDISELDFLKIDAEGFDAEVLDGFGEMLAAGSIRALQFEYLPFGPTYSRSLASIVSMLEGYGYSVGKLYPNGVHFQAADDIPVDAFGPNMIAVLKSERKLISALSL